MRLPWEDCRLPAGKDGIAKVYRGASTPGWSKMMCGLRVVRPRSSGKKAGVLLEDSRLS